MLKKKRIWIIVLLLLDIIAILLIVYYNNYCLEKIFKYVRELFMFNFSAISFIIAIIIYDQFGLNKKLTEKRVELIIELLTELKRFKGFGSHHYVNGSFLNNQSFYFEKDMSLVYKARYSKQEKDGFKSPLKVQIIMNSNDFNDGFQKIKNIANNPIMPNSIISKIRFLKATGGRGGSFLNDYSELVYLYFTDKGKQQLIQKDTKHWTIQDSNQCTLIEFIEKFDELFKACEDWTNKHSSINEKLNLEDI